MDIAVTTARNSSVCFDPHLSILNLSNWLSNDEIAWPQAQTNSLEIGSENISITKFSHTHYLSETEQHVLSQALLASVKILDEGSL